MAVPLQKQAVTIDEYFRLFETGVLSEADRLELLRGRIVEMAAIGGRHANCLMQVIRILAPLMPRVLLSPQNPLVLAERDSILQPDLAVLRPRGAGEDRLPVPGDAFLVVEIAESSLAYDRDAKIPLYAEAGIPEAWLVDLNSRSIFVYRQPSRGGYLETRRLRRGETASLEAFPEHTFQVDEILG